MSIRRAIGTRRRAAGLAALLALAATHFTIGAVAKADVPGIVFGGKFVLKVVNPAYKTSGVPYADNVQPVVVAKKRLLYTVDAFTPGMVAAYNLDTLKPLASKGLFLKNQVHGYLADEASGQLTMVEGARAGATTTLQAVRLHGSSLQSIGTLAFGTRGLGDPAQHVVSMASGARSSTIFLLSADIDVSQATGTLVPLTTHLTAVDVSSLATGHPRLLWTEAITGCRLPATTTSATTLLSAALGYNRAQHSLYFGCSSAGSLGVDKPPDPVGIGRVVLGGTSTSPTFDHFELYPTAADFTNGAASEFDPTSGRYIIQASTQGPSQFISFDTTDDAYVGSIGAGPLLASSWGIDRVHSRFYEISNDSKLGLLAFDIQPTPVSQGTTYPQFAYAPGYKVSNIAPNAGPMEMAVDPNTGRIFVDYPGVDYLDILRDTVPYFHEPAPPNPDANTVNHVEQPGVTGRQFSASAQGYGAVYRQVGGIRNLQFNVVPINLTQELVIGSGTREIDAAYLGKLTLDASEASASAIANDSDEANTGADLAKAKVKWPYAPATCVDFGGAPSHPSTTGAAVSCSANDYRVSASAIGGGSSVNATGSQQPNLGIVSSTMSAGARLDPAKGVVSGVTTTVHGINILNGQIRIGELTTSVEVRAHGRPGTARSSFVRTLQDVRLGTRSLCHSPCDVQKVATAINASFPGRLRIDFPAADPTLAAGSPGGYQAVVQRTDGQEVQEVSLNEQAADRVEVPGMIVTLYEDNTVPSRTIAYLGGVEAEVYYGIYLLGDDIGGGAGATPGAPGQQQTIPPAVSALHNLPANLPALKAPNLAMAPTGVLPRIGHGLQVLANSIGRFFRVFGVWLLLLIPVYLSARRWALLSRSLFYGGPR